MHAHSIVAREKVSHFASKLPANMSVLTRLMNDDMNNNNLKEEAFLAKEITFYRLDNNGNKFQVSRMTSLSFQGF